MLFLLFSFVRVFLLIFYIFYISIFLYILIFVYFFNSLFLANLVERSCVFSVKVVQAFCVQSSYVECSYCYKRMLSYILVLMYYIIISFQIKDHNGDCLHLDGYHNLAGDNCMVGTCFRHGTT